MAEGPSTRKSAPKGGKGAAFRASSNDAPAAQPTHPPFAQGAGPATIPFVAAAGADLPPETAVDAVSDIATATALTADAYLIKETDMADTTNPMNDAKSMMNDTKNTMSDTANTAASTMNNTMNKAQDAAKDFTAQASDRMSAMSGEIQDRAKSALEKSAKALEDMAEFQKGNIEAMVASGRAAAQRAEEIAKYSADYGRKTIEQANENARRFAAVKSPTEFFQLQSEVAKTMLDAAVSEGSKFAENYLKMMGDITQPMSNRMAVATDKMKSSV